MSSRCSGNVCRSLKPGGVCLGMMSSGMCVGLVVEEGRPSAGARAVCDRRGGLSLRRGGEHPGGRGGARGGGSGGVCRAGGVEFAGGRIAGGGGGGTGGGKRGKEVDLGGRRII